MCVFFFSSNPFPFLSFPFFLAHVYFHLLDSRNSLPIRGWKGKGGAGADIRARKLPGRTIRWRRSTTSRGERRCIWCWRCEGGSKASVGLDIWGGRRFSAGKLCVEEDWVYCHCPDGEASYGRRGSLRRHENHGRQRRKQFVENKCIRWSTTSTYQGDCGHMLAAWTTHLKAVSDKVAAIQ